MLGCSSYQLRCCSARSREGVCRPRIIWFAAALMAGSVPVARVAAQPQTATQTPMPIRETSAVLHGTVVPNGQPTFAWFEWGADRTYGQTTTAVPLGDGFGVVRASSDIAGLRPNGVYHCRLVSSNAVGIVYGFDRAFGTGLQTLAWDGRSLLPLTHSVPLVALSTSRYGSTSGYGWGVTPQGRVYDWVGDQLIGVGRNPLYDVLSLATGPSTALALQEDGTVLAWGTTRTLPTDLGNVLALAVGTEHCLALRGDGSVLAWGPEAAWGQLDIPAAASNVVAIAAGGQHCLALRADSRVVAWGRNLEGQCDVPEGLLNVVAIAAGGEHSLALRRDGTVAPWGLELGSAGTEPEGLEDVVTIACGSSHCVALRQDGEVVGWGYQPFGPTEPDPSVFQDVVAISAGASSTAFLVPVSRPPALPYAHTQSAGPIRSDHATLNAMVTPNSAPTLAWFEWGADDNFTESTTPVAVGEGGHVVAITASLERLGPDPVYRFRVVASNEVGVTRGIVQEFTTGRRVSFWGDTWYGPALPPADLNDAVTLAGGDYHGMAIRGDGSLAVWGYSYSAPGS